MSVWNQEAFEKRRDAWLETLTKEERAAHEEGAARIAARFESLDIRHQFEGLNARVIPCAACTVPIRHAEVMSMTTGEIRRVACQDHQAPCGRICLFSSEASHFGGEILRVDPEDSHVHWSMSRCPGCRPRPKIKIPVWKRKR